MKKAAQKMGGKEVDDVSSGGAFERYVRKTSIAASHAVKPLPLPGDHILVNTWCSINDPAPDIRTGGSNERYRSNPVPRPSIPLGDHAVLPFLHLISVRTEVVPTESYYIL